MIGGPCDPIFRVSIKQLKFETMKITMYNLSWQGVYYRFYLLAFLAPVALLISPLVAGMVCFPIFLSLILGVSFTKNPTEIKQEGVIRKMEIKTERLAS